MSGHPLGEREMRYAREQCEEWLTNYARALRYWNAPDDEHTRLQLRALVEEIIEAEAKGAA